MPLRCATMSGVTLLGDALSVRQSLQDAQDLGTVAALAEQGDGKVKGHGCARIVGCGLVGVFQGAPVPIGSGSGGNQHVMLPGEPPEHGVLSVEVVLLQGVDFLPGAGGRSGCLCFHNSGAALFSNLIQSVAGAVGAGVVAHRSGVLNRFSIEAV